MADIDKLEIEIEASSAKAVAQIKALNDQLKGLKSTLSGKWNNPIKKIQTGKSGFEKSQSENTQTLKVDVETTEAENRIEKLKGEIQDLKNFIRLEKGEGAGYSDLKPLFSQLREYKTELNSLQETQEKVSAQSIFRSIGIDGAKSLSELELSFLKLKSAQEDFKNAWNNGADDSAIIRKLENVNKLQAAYDKLVEAQRKELLLESQKPRFLDEQQETGSVEEATEKVNRLREAFNALKATAASAGKTLGGTVAAGLNKLKTAAQNALKPLTSLVSSFKRILFYRMVRTVIKEIGEAINTGMNNAYQFSKAIGGDLAASFDKLSSASYVLQNQLGAAFATALQSVAPYLIQLIQLATRAADALAQLFAVLGGSGTYLKANRDYMKAWGDETKKAGGAAKDFKKQLIGIDELNVLQEPSTGGGGGSGADALDFNDMFTESPLDAWTEKVKTALDWVKDHLDLIKDVAVAAGAAFLAWKLASGFTNDMSKILGFAMAIAGATIYAKGFIDAWNNGPDWKNLSEMIAGVALAAIGLGIVFGPVAAGLALITGGIGLLVVGFKDWIETGELSTETFWTLAAGAAALAVGFAVLTGSAGIGLLIGGIAAVTIALIDWIKTGELSTKTFWMMEAGIAAVGIALALLTGSWIPLAIAAVVGIVVAIVKNWNKIKEKTIEIFESITGWLSDKFESIKETATQFLDTVRESFHATLENIKSTVQTKLNNIKASFSSKLSSIKSDVSGRFNEIKTTVTGVLENIKSTAERIWHGVQAAIENPIQTARDTVRNAIEAIKGFFNFEFRWPNLPLPHFSISPAGWKIGDLLEGKIPSLGVSWYAKGGIVDGATLIGAGEAGKEAIVPLERNTEWINMVADGLASRMERNDVPGSDAIENATEREVDALYEIANRIIRAIDEKDTTVRIDSRDVSRAQNRMARAMGV